MGFSQGENAGTLNTRDDNGYTHTTKLGVEHWKVSEDLDTHRDITKLSDISSSHNSSRVKLY